MSDRTVSKRLLRDFMGEALTQRKYGEWFYVVKTTAQGYIIAIKAMDQRYFRNDYESDMLREWQLFIGYNKYKGGRAPKDKSRYRFNFFSALNQRRVFLYGKVKCIDKDLSSYGVRKAEHYRYFKFSWENPKFKPKWPIGHQETPSFQDQNIIFKGEDGQRYLTKADLLAILLNSTGIPLTIYADNGSESNSMDSQMETSPSTSPSETGDEESIVSNSSFDTNDEICPLETSYSPHAPVMDQMNMNQSFNNNNNLTPSGMSQARDLPSDHGDVESIGAGSSFSTNDQPCTMSTLGSCSPEMENDVKLDRNVYHSENGIMAQYGGFTSSLEMNVDSGTIPPERKDGTTFVNEPSQQSFINSPVAQQDPPKMMMDHCTSTSDTENRFNSLRLDSEPDDEFSPDMDETSINLLQEKINEFKKNPVNDDDESRDLMDFLYNRYQK